MNILYLTSEAVPFLSTGGLGDVLGSLPQAVALGNERYKAFVIMPLHRKVKENFLEYMSKTIDISFKLSWRDTGASFYNCIYKGVNYIFVENEYYFNRESVYGEYDDAERYAFFSKAVLEYIKSSKIKYEIIHANDWQTALSIIYLKNAKIAGEIEEDIKTVFTIHNIEHQGKFDPVILGDVLGLDNSSLPLLYHEGCLNFMKGGILSADKIVTVSPTYKSEICYDYFAYGLGDVVRSRAENTVGILNGIDYSVFSPKTDPDIDFRFHKRIVRYGKEKNKEAFCKQNGLLYQKERPLIVMITRLTEQKGIDLLIHILDELLSLNLNFVILGTGEEKYEQFLLDKSKNYDNFKVFLKFDRALSKKMYASADIFLMPSKTEPCGIAQMIACSYGAVPIVRNTGGLSDTIIPYGESNANGFRFDNYNAHEFLFTIKNACEIYKDEVKWHTLRKNCVNRDFSWDRSAKEYRAVYENIVSR